MSTDTVDQTIEDRFRELTEERDKLQRELMFVGDALLDEAESREWCDEYDSFCRRVNDALGRRVLTPCARQQTVDLVVHFEFRSEVVGNRRADFATRLWTLANEHFNWPDDTNDVSVSVDA